MAGTAIDLKCYAWLLFLLNFLFLLSGLLLIGLGSYSLTQYLDGFTTNLSIGLIVLGVFITLVSSFGCFGVTMKNRGLLKAYAAFVIIFMLAQVAIGITAYILRDDIPQFASDSWGKLTDDGRESIENAFKCCGWNTTFDRASPADCATNPEFGYTDPCVEKVTESLENNFYLIGSTAIAIGALELIVAIFACCLIQRVPSKEDVEKALLEEARRLNREGDHQQQYQYQSVPEKV